MKNASFGVLAFAALAILVSPAAAQSGGNAKNGKQLFQDYTCYGCHGYSGQNGPGAKLVPMKMAQVAFTAYVRNPRTRQMPSYSAKVLTDAQLGDIWAYVKTLPDAPDAKDIKVLKDLEAEVSK